MTALQGTIALAQGNDTAAAVAKGIGGIVGGIMQMAEKQEELDKSNPYANLKDPCVLVSRGEAEKVLGPLIADPYRVGGDKKPDVKGSACLYRSATGQSIKIEPTYSGGQMAMKMYRMTGSLTNQVMIMRVDKRTRSRATGTTCAWTSACCTRSRVT